MVKAKLEIVNRLGLHARAAAKLVHTANRFESEIRVARDGEEVDAKSILGILLLAAAQGTHVRVSCEGSDEQEALSAISELISGRFEEEQ
jgi:phosphocarrier protein